MIKVFENNYDRAEFYSLMGRFFAEKEYKKVLPYLENQEKLVWLLYLVDNEVQAFSSFIIKGSKIQFKDDFYIAGNINYLKELFKAKMEKLKGIEKPMETGTDNKEIKELYLQYGFAEVRRTKNYTFLAKEDING